MLTFEEFLNEVKRSDSISVFDIDDTLVFSKNQIFIKEPGKKERGVSTEEFAEIRTKLPPGTEFDFREFIQADSIYFGINKGTLNIKVLKALDKAIKAGHKIGILTARGNQEVIYKAIKDTILYKSKNGDFMTLPPFNFNKTFCYAISDEKTQKYLSMASGQKGDASDPSTLKAYVLQKIFGDKMNFKHIYFYDDDAGNIEATNKLKDPRITAIKV